MMDHNADAQIGDDEDDGSQYFRALDTIPPLVTRMPLPGNLMGITDARRWERFAVEITSSPERVLAEIIETGIGGMPYKVHASVTLPGPSAVVAFDTCRGCHGQWARGIVVCRMHKLCPSCHQLLPSATHEAPQAPPIAAGDSGQRTDSEHG